LQLSLQPRGNLSIDSFVRYVDRLSAVYTPAYTELNTRISWRPWPALELALVGENLLDPQHPESGSPASGRPPGPANEMQRSIFAEFRWTWP
jgi:iron complex outermembrane receptor protein